MADKGNAKTRNRSWFRELKAEFKKVIWPKKDDLVKETTAVVVVSVLLGIIISIVDVLAKYGIEFILK